MVVDLESPPVTPPPKEVRFPTSRGTGTASTPATADRTTSTTTSPGGLQTVGSSSDAGTMMTLHHTFSTAGKNRHEDSPTTGGGTQATKTLIMGMSKPVIYYCMGFLILGTVGAGLWGWITIPGLNRQIERLEAQVNRLESQVDRLESEVDRLGDENNRYERLNTVLNQTLTELQTVNSQLTQQVDQLQTEVGRLGIQVDKLEDENDRFTQLNGALNETIVQLDDVNKELERSVAELQTTVGEFNSTVQDLKDVNEGLIAENRRFEMLNNQLSTISLFLNETANNVNSSYEAVTGFLTEQITTNRVLVLRTLRNTYLQQVMFWDCSFRDIYRGRPFIQDEDLVIGDALPSVLEYVERRVLSHLCLDPTDFEIFMDSSYSLDSLSVNQLYQGVALYTSASLRYYFPGPGMEGGLTPDDWARAGYNCESVPSFQLAA